MRQARHIRQAHEEPPTDGGSDVTAAISGYSFVYALSNVMTTK